MSDQDSNLQTVECHACGNQITPTEDNHCPICGFPLDRPSSAPVTKGSNLPESVAPPPIRERGPSTFDLTATAVIHVLPGDNYVTLSVRKPVILGRDVGEQTPAGTEELIDLNQFGGYRFGVSRRHCQLERHSSELHVTDLGSSNGTFLNDARLLAHKAYVVCNGDTLRLGALNMTISFNQPAQSD